MVPEREAVLSWGDHLDLVDQLPQSCLVLPLCLSLSQRVFMKCTEAAVGPLRRRGIRVAMNIDDWLSAVSSRQAADHTHTHRTLSRSRLQIKHRKECSSSSFSFLSMSDHLLYRPIYRLSSGQSEDDCRKVTSIQKLFSTFSLGKFVSLRLFQRL